MNSKLFTKLTGIACACLLTFSFVTPPMVARAETVKPLSGFDSLLSSTSSSDIVINSLLCSRVGSVTPGTSVSWVVDATGDNLNYKFDIYKNSNLIKSINTKNNNFNTLLKDVGNYYVEITITNASGSSVKAVSENINVEKLYIPVRLQLVEASATSININNNVKWTSTASGDSLTYKWEIYKDNKKIYTSNESSLNYINYKLTETGNYKALSIVKDIKGTVATMYSPITTAVKPAPPKPVPPKPAPPKPNPPVDSLVKSSAVYATLTKSAKLGSTTLSKGSKVEILSDKGGKNYNVRDTKSGKTGWLASSYLSIPKDPPTNKSRMTTAQMEQYVNGKGFSSGTQYFIWVDIDRQLTNIFQGKKGSFKLVSSVSCATGKNRTPTTRGTFTISNRGTWFNSPTNPSVGAKYFVRFNGSYLFHSTLYSSSNKDKAVDSRVGVRLSHGCIRLPVNTAKWIYDNAKPGTKVFIN